MYQDQSISSHILSKLLGGRSDFLYLAQLEKEISDMNKEGDDLKNQILQNSRVISLINRHFLEHTVILLRYRSVMLVEVKTISISNSGAKRTNGFKNIVKGQSYHFRNAPQLGNKWSTKPKFTQNLKPNFALERSLEKRDLQPRARTESKIKRR